MRKLLNDFLNLYNDSMALKIILCFILSLIIDFQLSINISIPFLSFLIFICNFFISLFFLILFLNINQNSKLTIYIFFNQLLSIICMYEVLIFMYLLCKNFNNIIEHLSNIITLYMIILITIYSISKITVNAIKSFKQNMEKEFSYKYRYYSNTKIVLVSFLIYILLYNIASILYELEISNKCIYLWLGFTAIFFIINLWHYFDFKPKIYFNAVNLNNDDILNNNIYILSNDSQHYQIFKMDIKDLFPPNTTNHQIFINDKQYYNYKNNVNYNNDYVYLSINKRNQNYKLKLIFSYECNNENKNNNNVKKITYVKCDLYLSIKEYCNTVIINEYKLKNFVKYFIREPKPNRFQIKQNYPIKYHVLNSIIYVNKNGDDIKLDEIKQSTQDTRKWLFHQGQFGIGKTTIDINFAMNNGLQPVIVSPWEDNYDDDIIQLIYKKISKNHHYSIFAGIKPALIFLVVTIAGLFAFLSQDFVRNLLYSIYRFIICIYGSYMNSTGLSIFSTIKEKLEIFGYDNILTLIIFVTSVVLAIAFLPTIILFKKDNSKFYQDFYINVIHSIFENNNNILLIIEDVDRLEKNVYNNVFRILSRLNKEERKGNIIGLISLDESIIQNQNKQLYNVITDKLSSHRIAEDYDYQESIKKYILNGLWFLNSIKVITINEDFLLELRNKNRKKITNFRDARAFLEQFINENN